MKTITDLDALLATTVASAQEHPVVDATAFGMSRALLKFQEHSLNEVLGYALAASAGVPTPRTEAVWYSPPDGNACKHVVRGDIGILVCYYPDWKPLPRDDAAELDPEATGAALALCALDRHEWGEFGLAEGRVLFVDLERLLPSMDARWLLAANDGERGRYLNETGGYFRRNCAHFAQEAMAEAIRLRAFPAYRETIAKMARLDLMALEGMFDMGGHPLARLITPFAASAVHYSLQVAVSELGAYRT